MTSYIRLFEHLYVEISMMPSFSAFGYTKSSQKSENILFHLVPPPKNEWGIFYEMDQKYKVQTYHRMEDFLPVILILTKAVLKEIWR